MHGPSELGEQGSVPLVLPSFSTGAAKDSARSQRGAFGKYGTAKAAHAHALLSRQHPAAFGGSLTLFGWALRPASSQGLQFSVIVTEGRPDSTGIKMAQKLDAEHIPVTLVLDSCVAYIMDRWEAYGTRCTVPGYGRHGQDCVSMYGWLAWIGGCACAAVKHREVGPCAYQPRDCCVLVCARCTFEQDACTSPCAPPPQPLLAHHHTTTAQGGHGADGRRRGGGERRHHQQAGHVRHRAGGAGGYTM